MINMNRHTKRNAFLAVYCCVGILNLSFGEDTLQSEFLSPSPLARPQVFWMWMNGNVSEEGITADLEWMKKIGLSGSLIFNNGCGIPAGDAPFLSDKWLKCFRHAVEESDRLGLELAVHNGPGWSSSGGPWVAPEDAMKTVTWSETPVEGGRTVNIDLPLPEAVLGVLPDRDGSAAQFYRDIAVYAVRNPDGISMRECMPTVSLNVPGVDSGALTDGSMNTFVSLPPARSTSPRIIQFKFPKPFKACGLHVFPKGGFSSVLGELQMKTAAGQWQTIVPVGFPFSAQIQTLLSRDFPAVTASEFRLVFTGNKFPGTVTVDVAEVELLGEPRTDRWAEKSGFSSKYTPDESENVQECVGVEVIEISDCMTEDGHLKWNAPSGDWTVLRMGYTVTGFKNKPAPDGATGFEIDKLSAESLDRYFEQGMMKAVIDAAGPLAGKTLKYALIDSYEVGPQNWTEKFPQEFEKRRGDDMQPYLPCLTGRIVGSREISERFLWDFRRTVADLFADNYYGHMRELLHKHGMKLYAEAYGHSGNFEDLQIASRADVTMGEFWSGSTGERPFDKEMASAGRIGGKPFVAAEAFTRMTGKWDLSPFAIKEQGDAAFCDGINRFYIHRCAHQPWLDQFPGMTMGQFGFNFDRTLTWAGQADVWIDYLSRCQALLQVGTHVADVLCFTGEGAPHSPEFRPDLPEGTDYDSINREALLSRVSVRDGKLVLPDGAAYQVLVLPDTDRMTPETVCKIRDLVDAGATVLGPKPSRAPGLTGYPECDAKVASVANEVWDEINGIEELKTQPDCIVVSDSEEIKSSVRWVHRRTDSEDIYFLAHQGDGMNCRVRFRVSGKAPELWRPDSGTIEYPAVWQDENGMTEVPLEFGPSDSFFVVFRDLEACSFWRSVELASGTESELKILQATYGVPGQKKQVDVTQVLRDLKTNNGLSMKVRPRSFGVPDPAYGVVKELHVNYMLDGQNFSKVWKDQDQLLITQPENLNDCSSELSRLPDGSCELAVTVSGEYQLTRTDGSTVSKEFSLPSSIDCSESWQVRFDSQKVDFSKLISWTEHANNSIRYYSGEATYRKTVAVPNEYFRTGRRILLDLGVVHEFAKVLVNGTSLGVLWKPPFVCDVTDACRVGENTIEIKVTNLWPNRLIGDEQFPADVAYSKGGALKAYPVWLKNDAARLSPDRITFSTWKFWSKDDDLLPSGLLGPVYLRVKEIRVFTK